MKHQQLSKDLESFLQALLVQAKLGYKYWAFTALKPKAGLHTLLQQLLISLSRQGKNTLVVETQFRPLFVRQEPRSTANNLYATAQAGVDSVIITNDSHWLVPEHKLALLELTEQYDFVIINMPATAKLFITPLLQVLPAKLLLMVNVQQDTLLEVSNLINVLNGQGVSTDGFVVNKRISVN